jgi:hypothetical protein
VCVWPSPRSRRRIREREREEGAGVRDKAVGVAVGGEEMKKVERNQLFFPRFARGRGSLLHFAAAFAATTRPATLPCACAK